MEAQEHAAIALVTGLIAAWVRVGIHPAIVVVLALIIGVGIDFDHFVISRINTGSWSAVRTVLSNPVGSFTDQASIFEDGEEITASERMQSHLFIATLSTAAAVAAPIDTRIVALVAAAFGTHIAADLFSDKVLGGI